MEVTFSDYSELRCILDCVQCSLNINVRYEKHAHGKDKAETLKLIELLRQIETKLKKTIDK